MMNNKQISVIVPVYNVRPYLKRCIDSIIAQTYSNLEILLVDDGSTDGSGKLCDAYARQDARIQVIHKKNGGLSDARNCGIEHAKGRYFCFVDSDDGIAPQMIEVLYRNLLNTGADVSAAALKYFSTEELPAAEDALKKVQCMTGKEALRSILQSEELGDFAVNKLYKRDLFENVRYPLGRMMEDQGTTYKLLDKCQGVAYCPVPLYFYYQRPDSILHKRTKKFYEDKWDMGYQRYRDIHKKYSDMLENDAAMMKIIEHCYPYLRKDDRRKAEMERFLQEFRTEAEVLLDSGFVRKYRLLKQSRGLYSVLFLLKNGQAAR